MQADSPAPAGDRSTHCRCGFHRVAAGAVVKMDPFRPWVYAVGPNGHLHVNNREGEGPLGVWGGEEGEGEGGRRAY